MFGSDFLHLMTQKDSYRTDTAIRNHNVRTKVRLISLHSKYFLYYGNLAYYRRPNSHRRRIRQSTRAFCRTRRGNMPHIVCV